MLIYLGSLLEVSSIMDFMVLTKEYRVIQANVDAIYDYYVI